MGSKHALTTLLTVLIQNAPAVLDDMQLDAGEQVATIDKFPKNMANKNMKRIQASLPPNVQARLLSNGELCFVDHANHDQTSWTPPGWSQDKIKEFISKELKFDLPKLLTLHSAHAEHRADPKKSKSLIEHEADAHPDAEFHLPPASKEHRPPPPATFFSSPSFKKFLQFVKIALNTFNVVMASLLTLFVPQTCAADTPGANADPATWSQHDWYVFG